MIIGVTKMPTRAELHRLPSDLLNQGGSSLHATVHRYKKIVVIVIGRVFLLAV